MKVSLDKVTTLELVEERGVIKRLTREGVISGLNPANTDHRALQTALSQGDIPQEGTTPEGAEFKHLRLVRRSPRLGEDSSHYVIRLEYEHLLEGPYQNFSSPGALGTIYGKTRCSVVEKTTNFYRENGLGFPKQISVEHTFPATDENFPKQTIKQGGEVRVYLPQRNLYFAGYFTTVAPWLIAQNLIASVNDNAWANGAPLEWMCTEVTWQLIKTGRYHFEFEFQHDTDGWNPTVVFIDSRTGRPPADLVKDKGYKVIPYYRRVNFNVAFNAFFEGWTQLFYPLLG